jgi:CheY-like chemotaxis protein
LGSGREINDLSQSHCRAHIGLTIATPTGMNARPLVLVIRGSTRDVQIEDTPFATSWLTIRTASADAGYEMARRDRPDLIALDLSTSFGNAWTICRVLRQDPRTADIPVVVLADDAHGETAAHARVAGVRAVLNHPLSADSLDLALRSTT